MNGDNGIEGAGAGARLDEMIRAARSALRSEGRPVYCADGASPRFELFAAAKSICSQKVRAVLAHHGLPYRVHELDMFAGQTYLPEYVRLRMVGCDAFGGELASVHTGNTSASDGGCDGAVVPTLIDHRSGTVIVDSKRICIFLDACQEADRRLRPDDLHDAIDRELAAVDALPNYQLLMARGGAEGESAAALTERAAAFSRRKVAWCDAHLATCGGDEALARAYRAKRAKELSAADRLFTPDALDEARRRTQHALAGLEHTLRTRRTRWLVTDRISMADLFWALELLRIENVGAAGFWKDGRLPEIARHIAACRRIPAVDAAVLSWPGATF